MVHINKTHGITWVKMTEVAFFFFFDRLSLVKVLEMLPEI